MSPSAEIDRNQRCACGPETDIRKERGDHTIHEHDLYTDGALSGWKAARQEVINALPDQADRITGILG
jgi:hypothetical protein